MLQKKTFTGLSGNGDGFKFQIPVRDNCIARAGRQRKIFDEFEQATPMFSKIRR
jgi:hypothetical protein